MANDNFEVWSGIDQDGAPFEMVIESGTERPAKVVGRDWSLLGICEVADDIASQTRQMGYVILRTNMPFDPTRVYGEGFAKRT